MTFSWPAVLLGLLLIPLGVLAYAAVQRRRARYAVRFTNLDLLANVVEATPGWRRHLPAFLYLVSVAALVLALARPHVNLSVPKEQATVFLVTDVSGSMDAKDVQPTRLGAAKQSAETLLNDLPKGFKISLISFSNSVQTLVMPTTDREAVRKALENLRARGGTAMGDAIYQALEIARPLPAVDQPGGAASPQGRAATPTPTLRPSPGSAKEPPAILILLSDGANSLGSDPLEAAAEAKLLGVPIFTIALGTPEGVVDITDQTGRLRRLRVPPDEATLKKIAETTGARFFAAPSANDLKGIYEQIGSQIGHQTEEREITYWFAGAGAALVIVAGGLSLLWFNRFP